MSAVFLTKIISPHSDVIVCSDKDRQKGSGVTRLLRKFLSQPKQEETLNIKCLEADQSFLLQKNATVHASEYFCLNGRFDGRNMEKTIVKQFTARRADGYYCGYKNCVMTIAIDDVNLSKRGDAQHQDMVVQYLRALILHRT